MIEIVSPGPQTTVQDGGRRGYLRYGVSPSGAMDAFALALANILVGNARDEGALEATLVTPHIRFLDDTLFAATGGRCALSLDGAAVPMDAAVLARAGQTLAAAPVARGCRTYLAFAGGLGLEKMLGSVSCDKKAGLGGLGRGEKFVRGDCIPNAMPGEARAFAGRRLPEGMGDYLPQGSAALRVLPGPQPDALGNAGDEAFFSSEYTVLPESDRMGVRFSGAPLAFAPGRDGNIITDAVASGAIQITGAGLPILMMADAQTTGGYAKPFWLIAADLPLAAQLRPGDKARFIRCSMGEARAALLSRERALSRLEESWRARHFCVAVAGERYEISVTEVFPA
ncbi:MAG TPA: biotin-dependent carboxyltransferase family protein [Clostridia bacterium]|nr:biotin-dependent carboxyltransferase family protein [Clostridia bacterium]